MKQEISSDKPFGSYLTARRTIFDADICSFVNVCGLHEPLFIDMEYIKTDMAASHHQRFAPGPFLMTMGMGLVAPLILTIFDDVRKQTPLGLLKGMVNVNADIKAPGYVGDTIQVELIPYIQSITKSGNVLLAMQHILRNQNDIVVVDFVETLLFGPAEQS